MKQILRALLLTIFCCQACYEKKTATGGLALQQALSPFPLADNFTIELVASEPLISDSGAMEADENGNMYVVKMHGYP